ncbi:arginine-hydroxylase NDUFAF5, mitochondrial [Galendromus occidentalis]|uniref:Arginine-hydroxylase NDUFAF5, mitochondrial n=1 Tax=Galendromus occidentalis TaxID=34638 RepID=A0AAJ6VYR4_9ACAR|nr:arginine-hydroxylase NDUFAF5, mitochondrial [Galendromus occidentalis]
MLASALRVSARRQSSFGAMNVFDREAKRRHRDRWATDPQAEKSDYLKEEVGYRLADRLFDIKRKLNTVVELGCGRGYIAQHLDQEIVENLIMCDMSSKVLDVARGNDKLNIRKMMVDEEQPLPFEKDSIDAVVSSMNLHWVNNLPGLFCSVFDVLKPDGVFTGSLLGSDTLYELRGAIQTAENELEGGFGIHVSPFVQASDLGGLLRSAGFTMLTLDSDMICVGYPSMRELMADLKSMAENNCVLNRKTHFHRKTQELAVKKYQELYGDDKGNIRASFHILSFIGWKPHESQPKPAKRGSATMSLKDLHKLHDKPAE